MKTTISGPRSVLDLKRPPTSPGEMLLEEFLRPADLTQAEAARRMGIPLNRLNEIIKGKRGVTADTALRLARLFKMSPAFWMHIQVDWDLWHAARQMRKAREFKLSSDRICCLKTLTAAISRTRLHSADIRSMIYGYRV